MPTRTASSWEIMRAGTVIKGISTERRAPEAVNNLSGPSLFYCIRDRAAGIILYPYVHVMCFSSRERTRSESQSTHKHSKLSVVVR